MTSAEVISTWIGGTLVGNAARQIAGIADLSSAEPHQLSFLTDKRYAKAYAASRAGCVLVKTDMAAPRADCTLIVCADPYLALAQVAARLYPAPVPAPGIAPGAIVSSDAEVDTSAEVRAGAVVEAGACIGPGVIVSALAFVGAYATIGAGAYLHPGAKVLSRCQIGARVILHPGCVIGSDGFGFATDKGTGIHHKIPQVGIVIVGDDVEIGANTTVDRATFGATVIGAGCKIDNLVQIAHNVRLGAHNIIVSQSGIAGSAQLGAHVVVGAQGGIAGHLKICDHAMFAARAGVLQDIGQPGVYSGMFGVLPHRQALKIALAQTCVPDLRHRVSYLERKLDGLAPEPNPH